MLKPLPVIVCGKSIQVARGVKEGIRPIYDAIHVVTSLESGIQDIPYLLKGLSPPSKELANLGSQKYGNKVVAVLVGGGYSDSDFQSLRKAGEGSSSVPWLRHDIRKDGEFGQAGQNIGVGYGEGLAKRIVKCLRELERDDKSGKDGVYWF